jgi:hypothetical protein
METIQFECLKVALKQDKTGYILTVSIHPDMIPEALLRDYVGARYQAVLVRLDSNEQPMDRQEEFAADRSIRISGMLGRDPKFWDYLFSLSEISTKDYETAKQWMRFHLDVESLSYLKTNVLAQTKLDELYRSYISWKQVN